MTAGLYEGATFYFLLSIPPSYPFHGEAAEKGVLDVLPCRHVPRGDGIRLRAVRKEDSETEPLQYHGRIAKPAGDYSGVEHGCLPGGVDISWENVVGVVALEALSNGVSA